MYVLLFETNNLGADRESIALVSSLLDSSQTQYLLVVGAYRSNEVTASHPLQMHIDEIVTEKSIPVTQIELEPLSFSTVTQWIADLLNNISATNTEVQPLAEIIYKKTEGNPFFLRVFLQVRSRLHCYLFLDVV